MSSQPIDPPNRELDEELARTLVLLNRLSSEAVSRINDLMRSLQIRFAEAALQSGAVTQRQLDEALDWINQHAPADEHSLIVEVLRRTAPKRDVVLWEGDQLEPTDRIVLLRDPDHPRSETIRSLRTELLLRCKERRRAGGMIALLSPCAREGRSQLAAELAISFAQLGRRTLLVDADLRRPTLHTIFNADNEIGLAQALTQGGPHRFHGVQGLPEMALMTSGEMPRNPAELLSGRMFERAMGQWRRNFEFVILDTPPTSQFSDGLAVAAVAGSVLILGRVESTRFSDLNEIRRNLGPTKSRILGSVISRF